MKRNALRIKRDLQTGTRGPTPKAQAPIVIADSSYELTDWFVLNIVSAFGASQQAEQGRKQDKL